jgi:hypothetical protein
VRWISGAWQEGGEQGILIMNDLSHKQASSQQLMRQVTRRRVKCQRQVKQVTWVKGCKAREGFAA